MSDSVLYVLDDAGEPRQIDDFETWCVWFNAATDRRVARDVVSGIVIETSFEGLDYDFTRKGPPLLWETRLDGDAFARYSSRDAAQAGHGEIVQLVARASSGSGHAH